MVRYSENMRDIRDANINWVGRTEGKKRFGRTECPMHNNIKMDLQCVEYSFGLG
jgi:hypothetical protein